ncbi:putative lipoprotein with Yx(FWY)xxD motif [Catenulispora sp. EB89]
MGGMRRFLTSRGVPACAGLSLTAVAAAALLAGCSSATSKPDPYKIGALPAADVVTQGHAAGHWTRSGGTLQLVGTVTPDSATQFATALGAAGADTVRVTVTGGDLASGLAIGRTIHDRKLNLLIDGACAGPCADYWFPAAASRRSTGSGSWLGYVPDLSETGGATAQQQAAEAKFYTDSGVDAAKFHAALDGQLREVPGGSAAPGAAMWMPTEADLKSLGYSAATVKDLWLPPNLASANAQARAWQQVVAYQNTLVGLPPVPDKGAPAVPAPPAAPASPKPSKKA